MRIPANQKCTRITRINQEIPVKPARIEAIKKGQGGEAPEPVFICVGGDPPEPY